MRVLKIMQPVDQGSDLFYPRHDGRLTKGGRANRGTEEAEARSGDGKFQRGGGCGSRCHLLGCGGVISAGSDSDPWPGHLLPQSSGPSANRQECHTGFRHPNTRH